MISSIGDLGYRTLVGASTDMKRLSEADQLETMVFTRLLEPMMKSLEKMTASSVSGSRLTLNSSMMIQHLIEKMASDMATNYDIGIVKK